MRSTSSSKKFSVFEFNEEEECIERTSRKMLSKYNDPNKCGCNDTAVTKYSFLQCFAQGTKTQRKDLRNEPLDVDAIDDAVEERISGLDTTAPSGSSNYKPNELIGINSDDDDSAELSSSSTSASELVGSEGPQEEQIQGHGFGGYDIETLVVVSPDHVIYGDMFCLKPPRLTFSCSCIKLDDSTIFATKGPFNLEWTVADILNIESWYAVQVETAVVNLHLKSKDTKVAENANSSGIVDLSFAVFDPYWSKREEAIKSLDARYKDIWTVAFNIDAVRNGDVFLGQNSMFFSKHNFFNLDESFEDVIYPKGDPDAVSISKRDVQLLQPETFINDTIIDFYIKYLKNEVKPVERHRFHFFNSFFFRKLADLDKDPSQACEGRAAFQRVCKWTRKINLFKKDYIFIPVNFSLHWSLIVICHPGEVVNLEDEEMENLPKVPCILHLDSIKGSHRGLRNIFQSYLLEEWKERHNEPVEDISSKFLNLQFVPLELPQQENSFDCGLFLLHYVELFLEHAPVHFSPFRISKFSNFLGKDWFPPAEASLKRAHIKELIHKIVEDSSQKVPPSVCDNKCSSEFLDVIGEDSGVEFLHKIYNSKQSCHGSFSDSNADQDIDITPRAAVPLRDVQCFRKSKLVFDGLLDPGDNARSLTDGNCKTLGQIVLPSRFNNVMSPIEEAEEMGEQTTCSPTDEVCGQLVVKIAEPFRATETSTVPRISVDYEEDEKADKSSGPSIGGSPISSEVWKNEKSAPHEFLDLSPEEDREDIYECSSTSSDGLSTCVVEDSEEESVPTFVVEDSEEENGGQDIIEFENYRRHGKIVASGTQEADSVANTDRMANHIPPLLELEEWQGAKRPTLVPSDVGRRLKRRLAKDFILL